MREIHQITVKKENASQKWGFGITGGKDVALTFRSAALFIPRADVMNKIKGRAGALF